MLSLSLSISRGAVRHLGRRRQANILDRNTGDLETIPVCPRRRYRSAVCLYQISNLEFPVAFFLMGNCPAQQGSIKLPSSTAAT